MSRSMSHVLATLDDLDAPDLWGDIEARAELATPTSETTPDALVLDTKDGESRSPDPRRRLLIAAAGAAIAVVLAVVALINATGDDEGGLDTVDTPPPTVLATTTTTLPTTTTVPGGEDAAPITPAGVQWSREPTNLAAFNLGVKVEVRSTETGFYALGLGEGSFPEILPYDNEGLLWSADGVDFQPVDPSTMRVNGISPSWASGDSGSDFEPAALEVNGRSVHVLETTVENVVPPRVRVWSSPDGEQWSLTEVTIAIDPVPDADITWLAGLPPIMAAASLDTVVFSFEPTPDVDWWQFDPGNWDPDETRFRSEVLEETFAPAAPSPGPEGITFAPLPADLSLVDLPPFVAWEDLRPEARETYDWLVENTDKVEVYALGPDDEATRLEDPFVVGLTHLEWTGTQFVAFNIGQTLSSSDGLSWESVGSAAPGILVYAILDNVVLGFQGQDLAVSTDFGATFAPIEIDLPNWGEEFGNWNLRWNSVQQGELLVLVQRVTGDIAVLRSKDGIDWTINRPNTDAESDDQHFPVSAAVASDGTIVIYSLDGTVDIGRPTS